MHCWCSLQRTLERQRDCLSLILCGCDLQSFAVQKTLWQRSEPACDSMFLYSEVQLCTHVTWCRTSWFQEYAFHCQDSDWFVLKETCCRILAVRTQYPCMQFELPKPAFPHTLTALNHCVHTRGAGQLYHNIVMTALGSASAHIELLRCTIHLLQDVLQL